MGLIFCSECLDVLITSLDQAPLQRSHIPALFFLAETTLYWLRTDVIHQPYLRTGEIKLLKASAKLFFYSNAKSLCDDLFHPSIYVFDYLSVHTYLCQLLVKVKFFKVIISCYGLQNSDLFQKNLYVELHCI